MKLSIIVPCYNEEGTIGQVLKRILSLRLPCDLEIVVVDDGSSDRSVEVLGQFKSVRLIKHQTNRGKGEAIRTGIQESSGDFLLVQDSDLEYFPEDIPGLIEPILTKRADMVLGSRFLGKPKGMSRSHLLANRLLSYLTQTLFGKEITDVMTGHKVFTRKSVSEISVDSRGFDIEAELVGKFLKQGKRIVEVPIQYEYRKSGKAKITWKDGCTSLWTLFKIRYREYWQKIGGASLPIFILSFVGYAFFAYRDHLRGDFKTLNGDEPHYLITTKSIVQDHDLFLENNYVNPLPEIVKWPYDWHVVWGPDITRFFSRDRSSLVDGSVLYDWRNLRSQDTNVFTPIPCKRVYL